MGLEHPKGAVRAACLASAAALAALQAAAQEGGPPGSEAPGEMGGEVETIIVVGTMFRCPDGTMVGDIMACPAYVSFSNSFFIANWDPVSRMIRDFHSAAQTCGSTVDANCVCGAGKVKVYDDGNDTFHCKTEPPAAGCPKWDQTFDFDPNVWACATRPLDAVAEDAAKRIKACFGTGSTIHKFWSNVQRFEYGSCQGRPQALACVVSCGSGGATNTVRFNRASIASARYDNNGNRIDATEWQWFAEALNHEFRHVYHNVTYGCQPWNNGNFWTGESVPSWVSRTASGEEIVTQVRSVEEYEMELGVKSPFDVAYKPNLHKQLTNCRLW